MNPYETSFPGSGVKRPRGKEEVDSVEPGNKYPRAGAPPAPNKVLLFTIINAIYPITTKVMESICKDSGEVLRIVIFRKRGVQAMVEFDNIQSAQQAKASLNGADIYSGCCTLKIEYARPTQLNVYKNDNDTWDYTGAVAQNVWTADDRHLRVHHLAPSWDKDIAAEEDWKYDSEEAGSEPLLGDAPVGYESGSFGGIGVPPPMGQRPPMRGMGLRHRPPLGGPSMMGRGGMMRGRGPRPSMMPAPNQIPEYDFSLEDYSQNAGGSASPVVMVYGLKPEKMNCQKLFNVLCLYGNVLKVKFLKSKPGTAMVQMGDPMSVDRAIHNLSGVPFFGEKLVLAPSKQMYLTDSGQIGELDDKTPSFADFSNSKNNRFTTTEQAAKNRIQKPAPVLHYFNAPVELDEEKIREMYFLHFETKMCDDFNVEPPVKFTPFKSRSDRSSSGLLEFADKSYALECLTMLNHFKLENPSGRYPYVFKLCFSTSTSSAHH